MRKKKSPLERECALLEKQEMRFAKQRQTREDSKLTLFLADKIPDKLQTILEKAFGKAFALVFEKGVGAIEKTYNKEDIQKNYKIQDYTVHVKSDRKSLKALRNNAGNAKKLNTIASTAAGLGMGLVGVGIPDIPVFTVFLFRSVYQIALKYGYEYETEEEKIWILLLIWGAVSYGDEQKYVDEQVDTYIREGKVDAEMTAKAVTDYVAKALSKELLYMKFLQGLPVVGVIGGAYDFKYMNNITTYAEIKYRKRYLLQVTKGGS